MSDGRFKKGIGYWTGKKRPPRSAEWQRKLNESLKGKSGKYIRTEAHKKKLSESRKGIKPSQEVRQKFSEMRKGSGNSNWKGGITKISHAIRTCFQYRQWRSDVFTRDKFICQDCGYSKGGILEADHIKPLVQILKENNIISIAQATHCVEIWDINNGRTLCRPCHWTKTKKDNLCLQK